MFSRKELARRARGCILRGADMRVRGGDGRADVYTEVASKAFGRQIKKSDPERERLKTVFLGAIYGLGVRNMAKKLGVEEAEAKKLSDLLRQSFRQSFRWIEDQKAAAKKPPYEVRSFYGRKRRLRAYMTSGKDEIIAQGERYSVNAVIQGACVTGDTLILTGEGYLPISDIPSTGTTLVWTGQRWADAIPIKKCPKASSG
jgi:hypothetical protein